MANITIKQSDTTPPLKLTAIQNADGTNINLTGATLKLLSRAVGTTTLSINQSSTGSLLSFAGSTSTGYTVTYNWSTADLATEGIYEFELECTLSGGKVVTVPNDGYYTYEILDDIG